ncbi:MAG: energy-coupled thiamine transporter ThiT [Clostridiales bacterium]|nr:energy-coupled thiamine transporter ThiT [Clostridiales bacterium]
MFISSSYYDGVTLSSVHLGIFFALLGVIVLTAIGVNVVPRIVHKWEIEYKTRDLTYGAVCLALSYALSWIGISMPLGGTITIAALTPVFIYCYYFGFRKGIVMATAYMLLQFTQKIYIVHPLSAFFDYILPYFSLCVVGLFRYKSEKYSAFVKRNKESRDGAKGNVRYWAYTVGGHWGIFVGAAVHMVIRYASSVISGVICWDYWGYEAASTAYKLTFSLGYNSVLLIDSAIAIFATLLLLSSRTFNSFMTTAFSGKNRKSAGAYGEGSAEAVAAADGSVETETPTAVPSNAEAEAEQAAVETAVDGD